MAVAYATKLAEAFASQVIKIYYETAVTPMITNQDYEGEVRDKASRCNILTFDAIGMRDYSSHTIQASGTTAAIAGAPDDITESNAILNTDQAKAYYFRVYSLDKFISYIKNPEGTILEQAANVLKEVIDRFNLSFYQDAGAGNWLGTPYATGTVTVDVTTGVVTGSGTTFTAAMVGKPFKAVGHTKWYRVRTYSSATSITIEDDKDDVATAYTGGAIVAGAAYSIQSNTALTTSKALINAHVVQLATYLNEQKVPKTDRWLVVPAAISALIRQAPEYIPAIETAYNEVVRRGLIGMLAGFQVYENQQVYGDSTAGWRVLAGHKSAITHAMAFTETGIEDLVANFGKAYKGLSVYGSKVVDERRKALATAWLIPS